MSSVAGLCTQLRGTRTLFESASAVSDLATLKTNTRSSLIAMIDRLGAIDMGQAADLNLATQESGFDTEDKSLIQNAVAHKCLATVISSHLMLSVLVSKLVM